MEDHGYHHAYQDVKKMAIVFREKIHSNWAIKPHHAKFLKATL
jgi:hypothetical protein